MEDGSRTLTALVQHKPGVLARLSGLLRRRGVNIDSLAVGEAEGSGLARMTFVVSGRPKSVAMVESQLARLIEVIEVKDITRSNFVWRELALIKVGVDDATRSEVLELGQIFRARVVDIGLRSLTFEIAGGGTKVDAMIKLLERYGILEVIRTGRVATLRGAINASSEDGDFYREKVSETQEHGSGSV